VLTLSLYLRCFGAGYTLKGYGAHAPGFAISNLCQATTDGMLLVAALRAGQAY